MTQTKTRKYKWGRLRLTCDMAQASSPIRYGYADDEPDATRRTPFQVADSRHNWSRAFELVKYWLASQAG